MNNSMCVHEVAAELLVAQIRNTVAFCHDKRSLKEKLERDGRKDVGLERGLKRRTAVPALFNYLKQNVNYIEMV